MGRRSVEVLQPEGELLSIFDKHKAGQHTRLQTQVHFVGPGLDGTGGVEESCLWGGGSSPGAPCAGRNFS